MLSSKRPLRRILFDSEGRKVTLNTGPAAFVRLDTLQEPDAHLILGVGSLLHEEGMGQALPHPSLADVFHTGTNGDALAAPVYWLDNIHFIASMLAQNPLWLKEIPAQWTRLDDDKIIKLLRQKAAYGQHVAVWWYRQNIRMFPAFWAPIWGQLEAWFLRNACAAQQGTPRVFLTGKTSQLLHAELCAAFAQMGYDVCTRKDSVSLRNVLRDELPSLVCSVNMYGLDAEGTDFALLQALGIPLAIWFVDNPWHILSGVRLSWWREAHLFVTDASFVQDLQEKGAVHVHHLPLAASGHMWEVHAQNMEPTSSHNVEVLDAVKSSACTFVGRASFPDKAQFFAAARVRPEVMQRAMDILEEGKRPHFNWWARHSGVQLWPGYGIRCVGLGAEECSLRQRTAWLRALLSVGVTIIGDHHVWASLLPEADAEIFYPPVDYYTELAVIYNAANSVLNVTSLLLPEGLTQRHFDVWAAGGFLWTDETRGLDIFPKALTKDVIVPHYSVVPKYVTRLGTAQRQELIEAWQEHIREKHTYLQRINTILSVCIS